MKSKKFYRAPDIDLIRMDDDDILAGSMTGSTENITKGDDWGDFLEITTPPEASTEAVEKGDWDDLWSD